MSDGIRVTGRLIAAARALAGVSQQDFAVAAGLGRETLRGIEDSGNAVVEATRDVEGVLRGLEHFGVIVIDEADGMGAGVRLKFQRLAQADHGQVEMALLRECNAQVAVGLGIVAP